MQKKEANFSLRFRSWLKANPRFSSAFEMKQTPTNSISFSAVEQHQLDYGMAIRGNKGVLVRVIGSSGEPDYIYCRNMPTFIVIKYPLFFCLISVSKFIEEKEQSKRKSLTAERAKEIAVVVVKLAVR